MLLLRTISTEQHRLSFGWSQKAALWICSHTQDSWPGILPGSAVGFSCECTTLCVASVPHAVRFLPRRGSVKAARVPELGVVWTGLELKNQSHSALVCQYPCHSGEPRTGPRAPGVLPSSEQRGMATVTVAAPLAKLLLLQPQLRSCPPQERLEPSRGSEVSEQVPLRSAGHLAGRKGKSWRETTRRVFLTPFSAFFFRSPKTADPTWKKESHCSPPCSTTGTFSSCSSMLWSNRRTLLLGTGMSFRIKDLAAGGD